ncbi:uncharacterized protein BO72DRAFT_498219 [Aspergillus fijiensis CBS 313.89]|uniref:Uncharacterized protein n=1 Tax=Aspergillus fijiensis CBS 313.89 TaxID=1448319 RepID=A0A8G1RJR9_9EURO|nr:uncharacterized protein BO72DRAFT_498219 [Aspergillus fijiensis CBS 313.89]RAK75292.1 hypothetical protein BO72DRAFT_498219 [Aspergillus fijiensis CBS 313.89]
MIPGPIKASVVAAALHARCGLAANELLELRDERPVHESTVAVDTDHAGLCLGSTFTTYINAEDVSTLDRSNALASLFELFDRDFEQGFGKVDEIPTDVKFDTMQEYHEL